MAHGLERPSARWEAPGAGRVLAQQFRLDALLKQPGAMAVYRAFDLDAGRPVKVKLAADARHARALKREADALAALDHWALPALVAAFEEDGLIGLVQTYLEGPTLRERLSEAGPSPPCEVVALLRAALPVLAYLHGLAPPIVHRDIKPSNMVLIEEGVALIDFGIAARRAPSAVPVGERERSHTVGYAPPEQVIGLEAYPATDLYALAASALYMATGVHPIAHWDAARGRLRVEVGDPALAAWLAWLLAPGLSERCASAEAALAALEGL